MWIPHEKKLIKASWLVIPLRAALFLNFKIYSRRLSLSLTLAVDSHAMAWSFVFLRMKEALNLLRKPFQDLKPGGFLAKVVSVSVRAQSPADPSFIKERTNAIFLSLWLYISWFTKR